MVEHLACHRKRGREWHPLDVVKQWGSGGSDLDYVSMYFRILLFLLLYIHTYTQIPLIPL
jgi:hypothetical protein